jgi:predicted RNase H-like HicB family nuclease
VHRGSVKLQFSLGVAGMSAYFSAIHRENRMKIKVIVHEADEGGFWAEVPAIPGCATQGETMDELLRNLHEAIEGCLSVDVAAPKPGGKQRILEIAVRSHYPVATLLAWSSGAASDCSASAAATTSMARLGVSSPCRFQFMETVRSKLGCCATSRNWPKSPTRSCNKDVRSLRSHVRE